MLFVLIFPFLLCWPPFFSPSWSPCPVTPVPITSVSCCFLLSCYPPAYGPAYNTLLVSVIIPCGIVMPEDLELGTTERTCNVCLFGSRLPQSILGPSIYLKTLFSLQLNSIPWCKCTRFSLPIHEVVYIHWLLWTGWLWTLLCKYLQSRLSWVPWASAKEWYSWVIW